MSFNPSVESAQVEIFFSVHDDKMQEAKSETIFVPFQLVKFPYAYVDLTLSGSEALNVRLPFCNNMAAAPSEKHVSIFHGNMDVVAFEQMVEQSPELSLKKLKLSSAQSSNFTCTSASCIESSMSPTSH